MVAKPFRLDGDTPLVPEEDPSVFYPDSDDEPMAENDDQRRALIDTSESLIQHYADRSDVYVSGDMFIYYEMNNPNRHVSPDVFVSFGVADHRRGSYFVWREGKPPDFVLEVTSPGTWRRDATDKRDIYAAIGVTEYWRFDPYDGRYFQPPLIGERLDNQGSCHPIPIAEVDGILRGYSPALGLDVCVRAGELNLFDPVNRTWLRNLRESEERGRLMEQLLREHGITPPDGD